MVRVGRYGPYLERDGQRVNVPEDIAPDELTVDKAEELFNQPNGDVHLGTDPGSGREVVAKAGRFGPYVTELLSEDALLGQAEDLLTAEVHGAGHGDAGRRAEAAEPAPGARRAGRRAGHRAERAVRPYVKKGTDSRSLESEEQLFSLNLAEAKELFAQPKTRGRRTGAATPPLRELGEDPATGKPMVIKDGRFGPYVTDGETNASLRKGDEVASISVQRAAELLADRRRGPAVAPPGRAQLPGRRPPLRLVLGSKRL